ncbi:hypothetical protein RRSWK_02567 [Rhodopirellula sp. SWK7]|nr:hypothetical protein RRSWK_02567 [Rhodopirellula sp. SWK7]
MAHTHSPLEEVSLPPGSFPGSGVPGCPGGMLSGQENPGGR